jgi:hypothetical protein
MSQLLQLLIDINPRNLLIISSSEKFKNDILNFNEVTSHFSNIYVSNNSLCPPSYSVKNNIVVGSILTSKEYHNCYNTCWNMKVWHGYDCDVCKQIDSTYIYNNLPKKIDLAVIDCNDIVNYFEFSKVLDKLDHIFITNIIPLYSSKLKDDFEKVISHKDYCVYKRT